MSNFINIVTAKIEVTGESSKLGYNRKYDYLRLKKLDGEVVFIKNVVVSENLDSYIFAGETFQFYYYENTKINFLALFGIKNNNVTLYDDSGFIEGETLLKNAQQKFLIVGFLSLMLVVGIFVVLKGFLCGKRLKELEEVHRRSKVVFYKDNAFDKDQTIEV